MKKQKLHFDTVLNVENALNLKSNQFKTFPNYFARTLVEIFEFGSCRQLAGGPTTRTKNTEIHYEITWNLN